MSLIADIIEPYQTGECRLVELELGGFRSFEKPTRIPIAPLTLMFGPNSSGKTGIADAIDLLRELWEPIPPERKFERFFHNTKIDNAWRREINGDALNQSLTLNAKVMGHSESRFFKRQLNGESAAELMIVARMELHHFQSQRMPDRAGGGDFKYTAQLNGEVLFEASDKTHDAMINMRHPLLSAKHIRPSAYAALETRMLPILGKRIPLSVTSGRVRLRMLTRIDLFRRHGLADMTGDDSGVDSLNTSIRNTFFDRQRDFFHLLRNLMDMVGAMISHACVSTNVKGSRQIPSSEELTYLIPLHPGVDSSRIVPLKADGLSEYRKLARSLLARELLDVQIHLPDPNLNYSETVNYFLSHHFFSDRGYQFAVDCRLLVPIKNIRELPAIKVNLGLPDMGDLPSAALVTIVVVDQFGRRFSLQSVGSGVGYSLPMFTRLAESKLSSTGNEQWMPITIIQQPELHLHPALQSSIADAFIEALARPKPIVIETHSEHFLLRLLKRVRQTHRGTVPPNLKLSSTDICVLYFDPLPDGTTKVQQLRLSHDGEFIDPWPNGFFSERFGELFDE